MNEAKLIQCIQHFTDPYLKTNFYDAGCIKDIKIKKNTARIKLNMPYPASHSGETSIEQFKAHLLETTALEDAKIDWQWKVEPKVVQQSVKGFKDIKNVIAVGSAKGGVGKSTTAANLALALKNEGARVGLLDADIYGPNQPSILGLTQAQPQTTGDKKLIPLSAYGLSAMSIGFLFGYQEPVVWRGPMLSKALEQFIHDTEWGKLDYLIVDLPPGTGDIQMTLAGKIPVTAAVLVTTPQDLALIDANKSVKAFDKLGVSTLGFIANMSTYACSHCGNEEHIFGPLDIDHLQQKFGKPLLGELPLVPDVRQASDEGWPVVEAAPASQIAQAYHHAALTMAGQLGLLKRDHNRKLPNVVLQKE